ncbi:pyridoxamine 5'-phosphate oxidase family protein [Gymnodinialimonas ceratoperidinii]|uniref:Pyridoxamine 5'-phosphate oxidase family protein n=1 Tax=Gymnodinialimonas ceratoperidinii TaxID=2856823 RepID=A0A8F6TX39_9RHOB|nr:pyridoxamine 5'-phosphate oxidase family protein [Gymnodinialimonas ceratoperidinii]QXT39347.1 pyridoxamine 5'-phosphate oxidase family protein [Gymnodinialimonas ceratoperidinii]
MADLKREFWDRVEDVHSGMLGIKGQGRLVPMSPQIDDDVPGAVWFITAKGTDLAKGVESGPRDAQFVVANDSEGLWADIDGTLERSTDREALDEVWNFVADAWFEGGKHDPDVCLLKFTPASGEVSITEGGGAKFLYEIAKAHVTDQKPDEGEQGPVTF